MENLHATQPKTLTTYCIECGFGRGLPFKEVEEVFGELKV